MAELVPSPDPLSCLWHTGAVQGHAGVHYGEPGHLQGLLEDLCGVPCLLQALGRAQVKAQGPSVQQRFQLPLQVNS